MSGSLHAYQVGHRYHPDRTHWPEGAQYNFRGEGVELTVARGANNALHYTISGGGISPESGIFVGTLGELVHMLIGAGGLEIRDGRIVTTY